MKPIARAAKWIARNRLAGDAGLPHSGLMPAGFSAEHLGPNDFYFWDDFWSIAGLRAASGVLRLGGFRRDAGRAAREADALLDAVERSLALTERRIGCAAIPASPYRRMDSGAVASLAAAYPLEVWTGEHARIRATAAYLLDRHVLDGALFHDIAHSGLNPYLTLHLAQVLLRGRDPRFQQLVRGVRALASPTGKWPEAVHPALGTGCMGDGEHAWAAAEWIMIVRNAFVREELSPPRLVLCSGVLPEWREADDTRFGPTPTRFGTISVRIGHSDGDTTVGWDAEWRRRPPGIEVALPGFEPVVVGPDAGGVRLRSHR